MLWCNVTSWCHVHGDGCLQTPVVYDYLFNFILSGSQGNGHTKSKFDHKMNQPNIIKKNLKNIVDYRNVCVAL